MPRSTSPRPGPGLGSLRGPALKQPDYQRIGWSELPAQQDRWETVRPLHALLAHNPTAGTRHHDKESIIDALNLADIKADYVSTKDGDLKRALKKNYDLIVAAGGDGTIAYVFRHLARRSIPIGILPLGSANNLARSLGVAGTPAELAEHWRAGQLQSFHLMEIASDDGKIEFCAEGFGIGPTAALIQRRARGKKANGAEDIRLGREVFRDILNEAQALDVEVKIDGNPLKGELASVDILNIPFVGPALPLARNADPGDLRLDLAGCEIGQRQKLSEWIRSPHHAAPPVICRAGTSIEISWRRAAYRLDSKFAEASPEWRHARLRCHPEALQILVTARHRHR